MTNLHSKKNRTGRFNLLFASAFLLLFLQPEWIFHVGFQLSYLAVLSIQLFQNFFKRLIYSPYKVLKPAEDLVAITLAAQILTLPVCCYYFKQLPLHLLFSNMIAIPLSTILIYTLLLLLILHPISLLASLLSYINEKLFMLLNESVLWLNQ